MTTATRIHRPAHERGHNRIDWLDTWHTFSFADYHDDEHMGFRALRVINDDRIAPGMGFGMHPHRDMEIITYVIDGALRHRDSLGGGGIIRPGDAQRMSAGTGIFHSETNDSKTAPVRLLQIWILPERGGLQPGYEQKSFPLATERNRLHRIAAQGGADGSVTIHQDVTMLAGRFDPGARATYRTSSDRHLWLQVARGSLDVGGQALAEGDGLAISNASELNLVFSADSEIVLFDLA